MSGETPQPTSPVFKIGFEYETLMHVRGAEQRQYLNFLDRFLHKFKCNSRRDPSPDDRQPPIPAKRSDRMQSLIRFQIAHDINANIATRGGAEVEVSPLDRINGVESPTIEPRLPNNRCIRVAEDYGDAPCSVNFKPVDPDGGTWALTHDGSVKVTQASKEGKFIYMYEHLHPQGPLICDAREHNNARVDHHTVQCMEFVSPIMEEAAYETTLNTFFTDTRVNETYFYFNNSTTSNHVHISYGNELRNPMKLLKFLMAWWYFEPVFLHIVPYWRRNNDYCNSLHTIIRDKMHASANAGKIFSVLPENVKNKLTGNKTESWTDKEAYTCIDRIITLFQGDPEERSSRYAAINLLNLRKGGYGTVEFRLKHGSSDGEEAIMFIKLYIAFIKKAITSDFVHGMFNPDQKAKFWLVKDTNDLEVLTELHQQLFRYVGDAGLTDYFTRLFNYHAPRQKKEDYVSSSQPMQPQPGVVGEGQGGGAKGDRKYRIFCYGSNGTKQLKERTGANRLTPIPAYIENYTRIFAGYSNRWDGGVASVHPEIGARCYGMIIELTKAEMEILDSYEGGYSRVQRFIVLNHTDGRKERVKSYVYIKDNKEWNKPPSIAYLQAIRRMLDECNRDQKKNIAVRGVVKEEIRESSKPRNVLKTFGFFKNGRMCTCKSPFKKPRKMIVKVPGQ